MNFYDIADKGIVKQANQLQWAWSEENSRYFYPYWSISGKKLGYRRRHVNPKSFSWGTRVTDGLSKRHPEGKYYFHPNIIKITDGIVYMVEGETSLMTMYAANVPNSIGAYGCSDVPLSLATDMKAIGCQELRVIVDNDKPGRGLAKLARKYLMRSGIIFKPLSLERLVTNKGDVNDLWQSCGFNRLKFHECIYNLPSLKLPPYIKPKPRIMNVQDNSEGFARLREEIARRLPENMYKQNGYTKNFNCINPEHDDDVASAGFHLERGYKCFACGKRHDVQVSQWVGIQNWKDIVFRRPYDNR